MSEDRQVILDTIDDLVGALIYYDRKEDAELGAGDIERCIDEGGITRQEIEDRFVEQLRKALDKQEANR